MAVFWFGCLEVVLVVFCFVLVIFFNFACLFCCGFYCFVFVFFSLGWFFLRVIIFCFIL